jgi:hypothetical protein
MSKSMLLISNKKIHILFFLILNTILFSILIYGGSRHDYALYEITWEGIISNEEVKYHTYGPLHLFFSFFYELHKLLPKLIFGTLFSILQFYLFFKILKNSKELIFYFYLIFPCNFLVISAIYFYGINESVVTFFFIFSIIMLINKKYLISGFFFSISVLTKIYPLLLFPTLALEKKKINFKLIFSFSISTVILLLISIYKLDNNLLLDPIKFGSDRGPKFASILSSLNYDVPNNLIIINLIKFNSIMVLIFTFLTIIYCKIKNKCMLSSLIIVLLVILTTYKVGHIQYYIPLCGICGILLTYKNLYLSYIKSILPLIILLSLTSLTYSLTGGFDLINKKNFFWSIRENIGYVYFFINIITIYKISKINIKTTKN